MYITETKKVEDWFEIREEASNNSTEFLWRKIYTDFFWGRLDSRYFSAINTISDHGSYAGEGFAILAIQCSLIEFLESTYNGSTYQWVNNKHDLKANEYSSSKECFTNFLTTKEPFNEVFNLALAKEFYVSIRCGLLHEARTKNGWRIHGASKEGTRIICSEEKIVFRDDIQKALKIYIKSYGDQLSHDIKLQKAFIRKFNALCN